MTSEEVLGILQEQEERGRKALLSSDAARGQSRV